MGNRIHSSASSKQFEEMLTQYDIIQEIPSESLTFLEHRTSKNQFLLRQLSFNDKKQYEKNLEVVQNKKEMLANCDHVVPLIKYLTKSEDQFCSTFYKIYALFEYPQKTLDDEINERNLHKRRFKEEQIWSILASCILGLSHLQKNNIKHMALRSSMIHLSHEGMLKISDPFTTGTASNYDTLLNKRTSAHIYLSPQQCQSLQQEVINPSCNPYKSDIWALGMIILEAGLLQYQDECYRDECSRVHWETLSYNLNLFAQNYSGQLTNLVDFMLSKDERSRPEWIQLEQHVMKVDEVVRGSFISQSNVDVHNPQRGSAVSRGQSVSRINDSNFGVDRISSLNSGAQVQSRKDFGIVKPEIVRGSKVASGAPSVFQTGATQATTYGTTQVTNYGPTQTTNHGPTQATNYGNTNGSNGFGGFNSGFQTGVNIVSYQSPPPVFASNPIPSPYQPQSTAFFAPATNYQKSQPLSNVQISNISNTRPHRHIFPKSTYTTLTKIDQNLIVVQDDERGQSDEERGFSSQANSSQKGFVIQNNGPSKAMYSHDGYSKLSNPTHEDNRSRFPQVYNQSIGQANPKFFPQNTFEPYQQKTIYSGYQVPQAQQRVAQSVLVPSTASRQQGEYVVQTFKLGSKYQGYKLNGMRHGQGKFYYQDGGKYDGEWNCNKMEGYGKLYYQSDKIAYEGQWVNDQFSGKGVLYNQLPDALNQPFNYRDFDDIEEFWTKYEGQFQQDMKDGHGILYLSNGEYFEGQFIKDIADGYGTYTTLGGAKIKGRWNNNHFVG